MEKKVHQILNNFKQDLERLLPNYKKQIGTLSLCLFEIFEELIFSDRTKLPDNALSKRKKGELNLDNILEICKSSINLLSRNDLYTLSSAFGHMDAKLFDIENNAHEARKKITIIMNKIADKIPE